MEDVRPPAGGVVLLDVTTDEGRLAAALHRAVEAGQITAEQADAVLASERALAPRAAEEGREARVPPVLEALGYLGAVFVIVGAVTLVSGFWDNLETWSRLTILGVTAAALTGTGLAVGDESEPVLWRLRGVVLLLASGALAGFAGLLAADALDQRGEPVAMLVGSVVAAHSGLLWWRRERPAQHLAFLGGLIAACAGTVTWAGGEQAIVGFTLWAMGGAWLVASFRRLLPPAFVGMVAGAVLALVGAGVTGGEWNDFGVLFGLGTAAAVVAGGIRTNEFLVTAVGVIGAFIYLPATMNTFFGGTIGVPAAMLLSGLALLGLTVMLLQRRGGPGAPFAGLGWPGRRPRPA
jgi:hypothetical protein